MKYRIIKSNSNNFTIQKKIVDRGYVSWDEVQTEPSYLKAKSILKSMLNLPPSNVVYEIEVNDFGIVKEQEYDI